MAVRTRYQHARFKGVIPTSRIVRFYRVRPFVGVRINNGDNMRDLKKTYYFVDINLTTMKIGKWGVSETATHTGDTDNPNTHRIFLPKGQYNKLVRKLDKASP